jgi:multidrug efflux pump subunit AcrB
VSIVRFALKFPYTFYGLAALILFLGILAIVVMPVDIFPEINIPVVTVIWQYTGPGLCLGCCTVRRHHHPAQC